MVYGNDSENLDNGCLKLNQVFGATLRKLRDERKISQEGLAEASNLDRSFISMLERGLKQPSLGSIWALAAALDLQPHEIILAVERGME